MYHLLACHLMSLSLRFDQISSCCRSELMIEWCVRFDDPIPDDPFQSAGFITAFSQISVQQLGAFTLTARTFPGELADLERILTDFNLDSTEGTIPVAHALSHEPNIEEMCTFLLLMLSLSWLIFILPRPADLQLTGTVGGARRSRARPAPRRTPPPAALATSAKRSLPTSKSSRSSRRNASTLLPHPSPHAQRPTRPLRRSGSGRLGSCWGCRGRTATRPCASSSASPTSPQTSTRSAPAQPGRAADRPAAAATSAPEQGPANRAGPVQAPRGLRGCRGRRGGGVGAAVGGAAAGVRRRCRAGPRKPRARRGAVGGGAGGEEGRRGGAGDGEGGYDCAVTGTVPRLRAAAVSVSRGRGESMRRRWRSFECAALRPSLPPCARRRAGGPGACGDAGGCVPSAALGIEAGSERERERQHARMVRARGTWRRWRRSLQSRSLSLFERRAAALPAPVASRGRRGPGQHGDAGKICHFLVLILLVSI